MIRVGIVGISGYSGKIALELLLKHKDVRVTYVSANSTKGKVDDIWPHLKGKTVLFCDTFNTKKAIDLCDLLFLAVPHTVAMKIAPELLKAGKKVIDLSADYRIKDFNLFKKWYGVSHKNKVNLSKAVYGLPELYREDIKKADLIANPGCYPTAAILALAPIVVTKTKMIRSITIDAKSGVTGAGRKAAVGFLYSEINENIRAYKIFEHQHVPEIEQELSKVAGKSVNITFVPHLIPIDRGILETVYVQFSKNARILDIYDVYKKFYKREKCVRILKPGKFPETKNVTGTNYCDIGLAINEEKRIVVIVSAIDNLMKGASGQAVQNMNIMYKFKETAGLL